MSGLRHTCARRKGQKIAVPDLALKIERLLRHCMDAHGRRRYTLQSQLAEAMGMDPAQLSTAVHTGQLSTANMPALLDMYGLDAGSWLFPANEAERRWLTLVLEPFDAFCARVRLAGGDDYAERAGSTWDHFIECFRVASLTMPTDSEKFCIIARDALDWHGFHVGANKRMGPPGEAGVIASRRLLLPTVRVGQLAKVYLDTRAALPQRDVRARGAWVFMFQDVVVDRKRHIAPLVPFPAGTALNMPEEHIGAGQDTLLQVPLPRGVDQFLEIYADWGSLRSLIAVVTDRPLDDEIVSEGRSFRQLQLERLDLLAARLTNRKAWPAGSFNVWELQYRVDPATKI